MRSLCIGAGILGLLFFARAQQIVPGAATPAATHTSTDPLGRDNPQSTVVSFLQECRVQDYRQAMSYLDLHALPVSQRAAEGPVLAKQLEQLLNRNVEFDAGSLSRNPNGRSGTGSPELVATFSDEGQSYQLYLERVQLRPDTWVWEFSSSSVALIPQLYTLVGESAFERRLPALLVSFTLLDTPLWRWLALILLLILLVALSSLLSRALLFMARPMWRRVSAYIHTELLDALIGPFRLLVIVAGFRAGMEVVGPSALSRLYLNRLLVILFAAGVAWVAMRLLDVATDRICFDLASGPCNLSSSVLPLVNKTAKGAIFFLAITAILSGLGYNTTTVLAGVGVGGLAVAFAAQKTLENLFGGIAVISDRPVLVGENCRFGDRTGTVEAIGLRSTRIRTPDRTLLSVPNSQFSTITLENLSRRDKIWFHPKLALVRETTPAQIRQVLDSVSKLLASDSKVDSGSISVRFTTVGAYSLDLDVSAYILTSSDDEFSRVQQELLLRILETVAAAGVGLAFPTQATINYEAHS